MGLDFLGRGKKWRVVQAGICHILGAAFGGAMLGGFLGWIGSFLPSLQWQPFLIIVLASFALWHALYRGSSHLGRRCQVNRRLKSRIIFIELGYFLWGMQLGCGIITLIPYSSFVLLLGSQLTSGFFPGLLSGALFGGTREMVAVLMATWNFSATDTVNPKRLMSFLPASEILFQRLNIAWVLLATPFLILMVWR